MSKIGRNKPCPCGSGNKYKKCCINKTIEDTPIPFPLTPPTIKESLSFKKYITKNNSIELLKTFSLLQLLPKNQSKEFRLEDIQTTICKNINSNDSKINYKELRELIHKEYKYNYREDPCEAPFTENIMFFNGNNIVFPGMTNDSTVLNQNLLHSIFSHNNDLPNTVKSKIKEGTFFILHLFNEIAKKLGHTRNMFEDNDWRGKIFFPNSNLLKEHSNLFEFNNEDIEKIYSTLKIKSDIIQEFTSSFSEIRNSNSKENILTLKPFIKHNNKYYLVMPSCQMACLNNFINNSINKNNQKKALSISYINIIQNEIGKYLSTIWKQLNTLQTPLLNEESIWQLDVNKYAYTRIISIESNKAEKRTSEIISKVKSELNRNNIEFLALHITAPLSTKYYSLAVDKIENAKYQLITSYFNIERLISFWKQDNLSLWKYLKARKRAEDKGIILHPAFSILTYFKWYKRNFESFFPTDDVCPNYIAFDFAIQGEVIINSIKKNDKHFILYFDDKNTLSYLPVIKTETHTPIYTSEEVFNGLLRMCLEKYICPIWISLKNPNDPYGKNFIDSILFWLNEFYEYLNPLILSLNSLPVEIILEFEGNIEDIPLDEIETNKQKKLLIQYRIEPYARKIFIKIPVGIFNALNRNDNHGERILMGCVIKGFSNLLQTGNFKEITEYEIDNILDIYMPLSRAKMILTITTNDIQAERRFIPKVRYIQDSDTAIVLENNIKWLNNNKKIPKKITETEQKIKLCFDLINSLITQLRNRLKEYNSKNLLVFLMLRHEALIHDGAGWSIQVPTRLKCFSKYTDVVQEFREHETKRIKTSLAVRNLIEFVVAEPYFGNKKENNDDVDFLLAIMTEIINYGTIKDSIQFEINNPDIGLLPSGRIGIDKDFYENILVKYRNDTTDDEITNYKESFDKKFRNKQNKNTSTKNNETNIYYNKVDHLFFKDWGISLSKINTTLFFLSEYCLENEKSYYYCSENDFKKILTDNLKLNPQEIQAFEEQMTLKTRGKINKPENPSDIPEILPWRYNRKFSYIRRPILKIKNSDNSYTFFWSMRHLDSASENLQAIFHNGLMKVEPKHKNINSLLSERNNIKGKEFREDVHNWLIKNPSLEVIPHEVKISNRNYKNNDRKVLKSDKNYGDVDILAFNHSTRTIFSIECKNTKQAKIMYDFQNNIKNYIKKQLPKHVNREKWLNNNIEQLKNVFNLPSDEYKIKSVVISSFQLPVKYIHQIPIPIYSFNEIKEKQIFN